MRKLRSFILIALFLGMLFLALPRLKQFRAPAAASPPAPASGIATGGKPANPAEKPFNPCDNIYRTVCQKHGETRDPTGAVKPDVYGELRALRLYEEIIHRHSDWSEEQVDEELVKQVYTPDRRNRVQSAYNWVKHTIEQFIDRQPESTFSALDKKLLKARVSKTILQLPPPASVYADEPDLFTKNDVYYERTSDGQQRMRVGGAYLISTKSWFNIVFTMAHEFGHAFDPCELKSIHVSLPAYDRLTACFHRNGVIASRKPGDECGESDQLSEAFADWIAVHITAEALRVFSTEFHGSQLLNAATNSVRDLCEQDEASLDLDLDTEYHPSPEVRIQGIFGRNPEVRELLGCASEPETPEYCSFESPVLPTPVSTTTPTPNPTVSRP